MVYYSIDKCTLSLYHGCVCVYYMCVIICKVSAVRDMRRLPPPTSQQTTDRDARLILQARFPLKILLLEKGNF